MRAWIILLISITGILIAQAGYPFSYRSASNPYYWKNQPPYAGYWQQDVHYRIQAEVSPDSLSVNGFLSLTYYNNSPDILTEAFFHLYQNAFTPGSYRDQLLDDLGRSPVYGDMHEEKGEGTRVFSVNVNGHGVTPSFDNTIMRVPIPDKLAPGDSVTFNIRFASYWDKGTEGRRMKFMTETIRRPDGSTYTVPHLDGVHWYPRICVYDRKMRWETAQHFGKEFYGDFGTWEVALTFPSHYIVDATGYLTNETEMLPADLRSKLDIKNFADKPFGETSSEVLAPDGKTKTWRFVAMNVHDFAFTADPTYRIGEEKWNGIRCISLARERKASRWQDAASFTAKVIRCYSEDFGMYAYPKMIVADADDGMEYPMLTLDGDFSPGYYGLLAHEVGHNWFFGMVGSNETYRAFMDEGFTQFLTAWSMEKIVGDHDSRDGSTHHRYRYTNAYFGYLRQAIQDYDNFLNTHSDGYNGALGHENGYGQVYYKTATMLYNLQYVLGDSVFLGAMQHYFDKWKIGHPYPEDFRDAITEYAKTDLTWFFDQWIETDKKLDYAVTGICQKHGQLKVNIRRIGRMQMPVDLGVITKGGDTLVYHIPNTYYVKPDAGSQVLPVWKGWDKLNPEYTALIDISQPVQSVIIDPSQRLGDLDYRNNRSGCYFPQTQAGLFPVSYRYPNRFRNELYFRPNFWYNGYAGFQPGVSFSGDYMRVRGKYRGGLWYSTGLGQTIGYDSSFSDFSNDYQRLNYSIQYSTPVFRNITNLAFITAASAWRDGYHRHMLMLDKKISPDRSDNPNWKRVYVQGVYLQRNRAEWADYLFLPRTWNIGEANVYLQAGFEQQYTHHRGQGSVQLSLRGSTFGSDNGYGWIRGSHTHDWKVLKGNLRTRLFGQYGSGSIPLESALYLSSGNPEDMTEDAFYRSRGILPAGLQRNDLGRQTWNLGYGGGLNLRGYSGYWPEFISDASPAWFGSTGASFSAEFDFDPWIKVGRSLSRYLKLHTYVFYDAGILARTLRRPGFDKPDFSTFRQDAGLGMALDIRQIPWMEGRPLTLRLDLPFFLSNPPATEEFVQLRWIFGIGRTF